MTTSTIEQKRREEILSAAKMRGANEPRCFTAKDLLAMNRRFKNLDVSFRENHAVGDTADPVYYVAIAAYGDIIREIENTLKTVLLGQAEYHDNNAVEAISDHYMSRIAAAMVGALARVTFLTPTLLVQDHDDDYKVSQRLVNLKQQLVGEIARLQYYVGPFTSAIAQSDRNEALKLFTCDR